MVWKESTEIGIGLATGSNGWTYVCCHYAPAGNIQEQYEDNVLPPGVSLSNYLSVVVIITISCFIVLFFLKPEDEGEEEIEEVPLGQVDLDEDYKWERRQDD